jgi:hypothetical protein
MAMNDCAVDIANAALRAIHEKREMMPVLVTCGRIHSGKLSKSCCRAQASQLRLKYHTED